MVRAATSDDLDAVLDVGARSWDATYTSLAGAEYVRRGLALWWKRHDMLSAIVAGRVCVVESDGRVVGMLLGVVDDEVLDVWKLYVAPEAQRAGAGSALLRAAISQHRGDVRAVRLAYKDGNVRARDFYTGHGFVETHRGPDDIGGPANVWMALDLERASTAPA
ncbi:GNAT family N-acetyltransferase [Xylanimonas ulmi]|uniref:GNAT family N-acetyltransferase n=1 Tax=Xylanimonas ulmi TaxID=228973 RepID=UPI00102C28F4|nr:GNAT family N-acetyltransferase [Xylanibacterium ulmi]